MTNIAKIRDIAVTTAASALTVSLAYALATARNDLAKADGEHGGWVIQRAEEHAELMENYEIQRAQARAEHEAIMARLNASPA
ncbi:Uncharacterised protein [Mycobacteroides abscessus subsp. abscessus]|nr:hypothetical protein [Mycobacteroides abscessus]SHQ44792.1 Uncharacterised protein [Mycobacteroides abscessus subsp. abscessus]SHQ52376.1 Uncharacterised protein [Mycobacteroides abscessus subsp. abscessus]SHY14247.1 Uncharacterised protein [Mycobacteroides abscessus subsp. abscessus]SLL30517.1 Uncharacterised protein [Mycobacteroides abscessus subsp. abscessus]